MKRSKKVEKKVKIEYYDDKLEEGFEKHIIAWAEKHKDVIREALEEIRKSKFSNNLRADFSIDTDFPINCAISIYAVDYLVSVSKDGVFLVVREYSDWPHEHITETRIAKICL